MTFVGNWTLYIEIQNETGKEKASNCLKSQTVKQAGSEILQSFIYKKKNKKNLPQTFLNSQRQQILLTHNQTYMFKSKYTFPML